MNPGPVIGTANPNGAIGKGHFFQEFPHQEEPHVWALAETHLTAAGMPKFRQELACMQQKWHFVPGAMAPQSRQHQG